MFEVYLAKSETSGKSYIGITNRSVRLRISEHIKAARLGSNLLFHKAIRAYGIDDFDVSVIATTSDRDSASKLEIEMIESLNTKAPNGYNMTAGGEGVIDLCEESIDKKSKSAKFNHSDPEFSRRHVEGINNFWKSDRGVQARKRISEMKKNHVFSEESLRKAAEAKKSKEYLSSLSERVEEQWKDDEFRSKWLKSRKLNHLDKAEKFPRNDTLDITFASTRDASRYMAKNGYPKAAPNNICLACNGKYKSSYGCKWSWVSRDDVDINGIRRIDE